MLMILRCEGSQITVEKKQTIELTMEESPEQAASVEEPKVAAWLKAWGIQKQETFVQQGEQYEKLVRFSAIVPSAPKAQQLISRIAKKLPKFIDSDDKQAIEQIIKTAVKEEKKYEEDEQKEERPKRAAPEEQEAQKPGEQQEPVEKQEPVEIVIKRYPVELSVMIQLS